MNGPAIHLPTPLPQAPTTALVHRQPEPDADEFLNLAISEEQKLELLELWRSITKRRWMIGGLALAAALLAAVIAMAMTPIYRSTVTLFIESGKNKIVSIEEIYAAGQQREFFQSQVEILKSRSVLERTVDALKLDRHRAFGGAAHEEEASWGARLRGALGIAKMQDASDEDVLRDAAVRQLEAMVQVEPIRNSQLVKASVDSEDAALAARIANTLADQYVKADRDSRFKVSQEASTFLTERLATLRDKLVESEQALQAYRDEKGIVSLGGSAQTTAAQIIAGTSEKLTEARAKRLELENTLAQIRASREGDYVDAPAVMRDPGVADTLKLLNEARRKLGEASLNLGPMHPKMLQLQGEIDLLRSQLRTQRDAVAATLAREYRAASGQEASLRQALEAAKDEVQGVNRKEFQLTVLERDVQSNRQLYDMFMSRAKETDLAGDVQASVARVIDKALPGETPVRPRKALIVAVATLMALLLGAGASILLDRIDNTVKGADDAEMRLRKPVLTAVPLVTGVNRARMARLFIDDAHSHYAEAIRTARTGVLLSNIDVSNKILLVTSSLPGEGKTTLAINLALAHAQTRKTLLIDCDMRMAQVTRQLGIAPGTKGLSNLVAGANTEKECILLVRDSLLDVMPVGDLPPVPLEMLLSERFRQVLQQLSQRYEMVIIDSPPVELVSDALVIAPMATGVAFVVKAMDTPAPLARKALSRLQRAGGNVFGVIVNQLDFERAHAYYGDYAASSYSYGTYGGYGTYGQAPDAAAGGSDSATPPRGARKLLERLVTQARFGARRGAKIAA